MVAFRNGRDKRASDNQLFPYPNQTRCKGSLLIPGAGLLCHHFLSYTIGWRFAYCRVLSSLARSDDMGLIEISNQCICLVLEPSTFPRTGWIHIICNSVVFAVAILFAERRSLMSSGSSWVMAFGLFREETYGRNDSGWEQGSRARRHGEESLVLSKGNVSVPALPYGEERKMRRLGNRRTGISH